MKAGLIATAILMASLLAVPVHAQQNNKDTAIKPAPGPSQAVLEQWNDVGRKLIAMAEDFPEDKYDFKPTPPQRTFAEQLLHAAGANYYFTNLALGEKPPAEEDPKRDQYKTKADVVAFVKKSFADGAAAIQKKGDKGMADLVVDPGAHQQFRIIWPTASSSITANTMASWRSTIASQVWCRQSLGPRSNQRKVAELSSCMSE
jgi:hypothetical protein